MAREVVFSGLGGICRTREAGRGSLGPGSGSVGPGSGSVGTGSGSVGPGSGTVEPEGPVGPGSGSLGPGIGSRSVELQEWVCRTRDRRGSVGPE